MPIIYIQKGKYNIMKLHIEEATANTPCENILYTDSTGRAWKYRISTNLGEEIKRFYKKSMSVNESNYSRLTVYINNGCFMISACRDENDEETNRKNTDNLAEDIQSYGLGYVRVLGGYVENKNTSNEKEVVEESFFVPQPKNISDEEFFDIAIKLCKKYNQDSVLISMPECSDFGYYDKTGRLVFSPDKDISFIDDAVKQYFSALVKGSNCKWLAVRNPNSFTQAVLMDKNKENLLFRI